MPKELAWGHWAWRLSHARVLLWVASGGYQVQFTLEGAAPLRADTQSEKWSCAATTSWARQLPKSGHFPTISPSPRSTGSIQWVGGQEEKICWSPVHPLPLGGCALPFKWRNQVLLGMSQSSSREPFCTVRSGARLLRSERMGTAFFFLCINFY